MEKKRGRKKKTKKENSPAAQKTKLVNELSDERDYGGMDLSNFKRNLGCGG